MTTAPKGEGVSLRISVTDRCQMRCRYCMPGQGVQAVSRDKVMSFEEIATFVRTIGSSFGILKVHITGGEPLVREGVATLVGMIRDEGVDEIALTTNGQLLGALAGELHRSGLARVNVSLDSLKEETYRHLTCGGALGNTLAGIDAAIENDLTPVKLNMTVLRDVNFAEVADVARFALARGCTLRFLELMPIGPAAARHDEWFVSTAEVKKRLASEFHLEAKAHKPGTSAREFAIADDDGNAGTVGFISSQSEPFCLGCSRIRLTSTGDMIGCLALGEAVNIRHLVACDVGACDAGARDAVAAGRDEGLERLLEHVSAALSAKRERKAFVTSKHMVEVGG